MARYDYRCNSCDRVFEVRRAVADSCGDVTCPRGHRDVMRLWSAVAVAVGGRSGGAALSAPPSAPGSAAGGCCGGGCCGGG